MTRPGEVDQVRKTVRAADKRVSVAGKVRADENGVVLADQFPRQFVVVEASFECAVGEDQMGFRIVIGAISHGWLREKEKEKEREREKEEKAPNGITIRHKSESLFLFVLFVSGSELKLGLINFISRGPKEAGKTWTRSNECNTLPFQFTAVVVAVQPGEAQNQRSHKTRFEEKAE